MDRMVLIVDDEERILFVLERVLNRLGDALRVETASTADDALRKVAERAYDLVVSDLVMPEMDGVELTEKILQLSPGTAVIWMTAYGCRRFKQDAQRLKVHTCMEKPVDVHRFRRVVREATSLVGGETSGSEAPR